MSEDRRSWAFLQRRGLAHRKTNCCSSLLAFQCSAGHSRRWKHSLRSSSLDSHFALYTKYISTPSYTWNFLEVRLLCKPRDDRTSFCLKLRYSFTTLGGHASRGNWVNEKWQKKSRFTCHIQGDSVYRVGIWWFYCGGSYLSSCILKHVLFSYAALLFFIYVTKNVPYWFFDVWTDETYYVYK